MKSWRHGFIQKWFGSPALDYGATPTTAMLNVSGTTRVLVATTPVDLRGSFDRLYSLVIVEDGFLKINNNLIENAIRPTALGKKNFLFIGHPEAGERSAVKGRPAGRESPITHNQLLILVRWAAERRKSKSLHHLKSKKPEIFLRLLERLAATYSRRTYRTTTIGKTAFDGRVRNGIGSDHSFMATKN